MNQKKTPSSNGATEDSPSIEVKKRCFVIMPISDHPDYDVGHFERVYDEIVKPAVLKAGFEPRRADDVKATHVIILEILKNITEYEMAICDLSSLNPNVLYELGIRQMTQKPVVLIKDKQTRRIFDIGLISDIEYDSSLRVDTVKNAIMKIASALTETYENRENTSNSLVDLLNVVIKTDPKIVEVSTGEQIILDEIKRLRREVNDIDSEMLRLHDYWVWNVKSIKGGNENLSVGDVFKISDPAYGDTMFVITNAPTRRFPAVKVYSTEGDRYFDVKNDFKFEKIVRDTLSLNEQRKYDGLIMLT